MSRKLSTVRAAGGWLLQPAMLAVEHGVADETPMQAAR